MLYIFEGMGNTASIVENASGINTSKAIQVEELPTNPYKYGELRIDVANNKLWWIEANPPQLILKSELLSRLTEEELDNIINFEDVITDIEKKKLMRKVMFKFNNYQEVDLSHPDTANFANALVYCGILTVERVNDIIGV